MFAENFKLRGPLLCRRGMSLAFQPKYLTTGGGSGANLKFFHFVNFYLHGPPPPPVMRSFMRLETRLVVVKYTLTGGSNWLAESNSRGPSVEASRAICGPRAAN